MSSPPRSDDSSAQGDPPRRSSRPPSAPIEPMPMIALEAGPVSSAEGRLEHSVPAPARTSRPPPQPSRPPSLPPPSLSSLPPPRSSFPPPPSAPPRPHSSLPPRPSSVPPGRPSSLPPPPRAPSLPPPELDEPEVSFSYVDDDGDLELMEGRISDLEIELSDHVSSVPPQRSSLPPPARLQPPPPPRSLPPPPPRVSARPSLPPPTGEHSPTMTPPPPRRSRPWWEELFDDAFTRTLEVLTPVQVLREATFIEDSLGIEPGGSVLDLACGSGAHSVELSSRGYRVVGLDFSSAMLARASREAESRRQKLDFMQGDMREMSFDANFDGVYCWSSSFGFFDDEANALVARSVHKALRTGGRFLLDVLNRDFVVPRQPRLVWFQAEGCICFDETEMDFITSRLKVKRTVMLPDGRSREVEYSIRLYTLHELGKMLHDAGFRVIEISGQAATPGAFFGSDSPRLIVLAEKA